MTVVCPFLSFAVEGKAKPQGVTGTKG